MEKSELTSEIGALLRGLRSCDTQTTAVAWMTRAYKMLEHCLPHLETPSQSCIFLQERPKLEIVQAFPNELQKRAISTTVVYPETFFHPGLKPIPKAWTREDTMRLVRAANISRAVIQKRGR